VWREAVEFCTGNPGYIFSDVVTIIIQNHVTAGK